MAGNSMERSGGRVPLPKLIADSESRIAEVLPPGMDPRRVVRLARLAVHRNPMLLQCDPVSVIEAILVASQLGLEINSPIGGAHLVPYRVKGGASKCQMIPDYRGMIRLALKAGSVRKMVAREVYALDHFELLQGTTDRLVHVPVIDSEPRSDDDIIAFYAVATMPTGETVHEWAPRGDVDKVRDRSKAKDSGPWVSDYAAMGKKTIVKRLCKWLDLSPELGAAIEWDNRYESGEASGTVDGDDEAAATAQMAEATARARDEMTEKLAQQRRTEILGDESNGEQ